MLSSCKTCIISLVRERALLWGTLLFPLKFVDRKSVV